MRNCRLWAVSAVAGVFLPAATHAAAPQSSDPPLTKVLTLVQDRDPYESIYEPPGSPRVEEGVNNGGVNFDLRVAYMTDYVFRGIDQSERLASRDSLGITDPAAKLGHEDAPNLQFDGFLTLNLGRMPHPVAGVFVNIYNDDPISRFQEIRPYFGLDWNLKPLRIQAGQISYVYPERENLNTQEAWASVTFDDSRLWRTERPVFSPYGYAAYDYDLYDGLYAEMGLRHEFELEDTGIMLTAVADVAYVLNHELFTDTNSPKANDTGFQHYDLGLIGTYSLNKLMGIPRRYGQWTLNGYLYYTDGINEGLLADTQVWGGVSIGFRY